MWTKDIVFVVLLIKKAIFGLSGPILIALIATQIRRDSKSLCAQKM